MYPRIRYPGSNRNENRASRKIGVPAYTVHNMHEWMIARDYMTWYSGEYTFWCLIVLYSWTTRTKRRVKYLQLLKYKMEYFICSWNIENNFCIFSFFCCCKGLEKEANLKWNLKYSKDFWCFLEYSKFDI